MASDFKLFKKKDDKKITDRIFLFPIRASLQLLSRIMAARTNIMFSLSAKEKKMLCRNQLLKG